jgi:membrane associated rhomboid family serine protease
LLFPPIPIKAKWFVIGYGAVELFAGVTGTVEGVAHFAHLGGMVTGFLLLLYWRPRPPTK